MLQKLNIFKDLKIKYKLFIMVALPIAGLSYFAWIAIEESLIQEHKNKVFDDLVKLSMVSNALVHEIQKERGLSVGFLGSQGRNFAQQLEVQRRTTDQAVSTYHRFIDRLLLDDERTDFKSVIDRSRLIIDGIPGHRQVISAQSITPSETLILYSKLNTELLKLTEMLVKASPTSDLGNRVVAYSMLLHSKELSGKERAILSNTFASAEFGEADYILFREVLNAQEMYIDLFLTIAPNNYISFYQEMTADPAFAEVDRLRDIAEANASTGEFNIDAEYWFQLVTQKINAKKSMEDAIALELQDTSAEALAEAHSFTVVKVVKTIFILIVTILLSLYFKMRIVGPINESVELAESIAEGRLNNKVNVTSNDEIGQLMLAVEAMQGKLQEVILTTKDSASVVQSTAKEIAQGNMNLSQRTEQQASNLEETAASMEQMTNTVKQNAENAKHASQLAKAARDEAEQGGAVVGSAVTAMRDINQSSKRIADIISVIDEIAFQTNLLALNAAVEAARAGEQGRGFAVVASEVRNLASRSATAAKEIKELIVDSVSKTENGTALVNQSGDTLDGIMTSVNKVNDIVAEIAVASQEQASNIQQVTLAITQMDDLTQQNAALVEEAAASSEIMDNRASTLMSILQFFSLSELKVMSSSEVSVPPAARQPRPAVQTVPTQQPAYLANSSLANNALDEEWEEF